MWAEALNLAGIPIASEWRKAENIYYPTNIREVPVTLPFLAAPPPPRPLFLLLRSLEGLARLVTKARVLRGLRVSGLAKVVLG